MPTVEYQLSVVVSSIESFMPDETELAVLYNLLIFDPGKRQCII